MPVPSNFPYGQIYGHNLNQGKSKAQAKRIVEAAMRTWKKKRKNRK